MQLSSSPRLRAATLGGFLVAGLLLPTAVMAQWVFATGTTVDVAGTLVTPRDVVTDLPGSIAATTVTGLPSTARLVGVHADPGSATLFVSSQSVELPGAVFAERRDVAWVSDGTYTVALDGSSVGLPADAAIDGVSRNASGHFLLSLDTSVDLAGLFAEDADIVAWDGLAFTTFFDASTASVPAELDVDGLHYDVAGDALLLSFDAASQIDGIDFGREDILRFELGGGGWSLAYDASATEPDLATSDLTAVPEPTTALGLVAGALALAVMRRAVSRR